MLRYGKRRKKEKGLLLYKRNDLLPNICYAESVITISGIINALKVKLPE